MTLRIAILALALPLRRLIGTVFGYIFLVVAFSVLWIAGRIGLEP